MIEGVVVKDLKTFPDERGFFREIVRFEDFDFEPAQSSHALRVGGVANGWHIHRYHSELFYVTKGILRVVLKDCRYGTDVEVDFPYDDQRGIGVNFGKSTTAGEYQEVILSEHAPKVVLVPNGVAHGYKALGGECDIIYWATRTYEYTRHDEGRIDPHRWGEHLWDREIEAR